MVCIPLIAHHLILQLDRVAPLTLINQFFHRDQFVIHMIILNLILLFGRVCLSLEARFLKHFFVIVEALLLAGVFIIHVLELLSHLRQLLFIIQPLVPQLIFEKLFLLLLLYSKVFLFFALILDLLFHGLRLLVMLHNDLPHNVQFALLFYLFVAFLYFDYLLIQPFARFAVSFI